MGNAESKGTTSTRETSGEHLDHTKMNNDYNILLNPGPARGAALLQDKQACGYAMSMCSIAERVSKIAALL
jgi:hypothetical protein